jgi:hypothetical protein
LRVGKAPRLRQCKAHKDIQKTASGSEVIEFEVLPDKPGPWYSLSMSFVTGSWDLRSRDNVPPDQMRLFKSQSTARRGNPSEPDDSVRRFPEDIMLPGKR